MSTYAENQAARERKQRKVAQDQFLSHQTARFDAEAAAGTDKRGNWTGMKYQRPSFTVVTASDAFRAGYDHIKWDNADEPESAKVVMEHSDRTGSAG